MQNIIAEVIQLLNTVLRMAERTFYRSPSEHDIAAFRRLTQSLPEPQLHGFLNRAGAAGVIDTGFAARIEDWQTEATLATNTFDNGRLEKAKTRLWRALDTLLACTHRHGFSAVGHHGGVATVRPDIKGIEGPTPVEYPTVRAEVQNLAHKAQRQYSAFLKDCTRRLRL
ncbi:MAG: hypothetical protein WBD55_03250 [Dehalococcoidia bacterium]